MDFEREISGVTVGEIANITDKLLETIACSYDTDTTIGILLLRKNLCDKLDGISFEYAADGNGKVSPILLAVMFSFADAAIKSAFACVEYQEGIREIKDLIDGVE